MDLDHCAPPPQRSEPASLFAYLSHFAVTDPVTDPVSESVHRKSVVLSLKHIFAIVERSHPLWNVFSSSAEHIP